MYVDSHNQGHAVLNNRAKHMCPLGGNIAHYLWATFHLRSWLHCEPLWLRWKSHKSLLGDSTGLTADTLMEPFIIGREGNDSVSQWLCLMKYGEVCSRFEKWNMLNCLNLTAITHWRAQVGLHSNHLVSSYNSSSIEWAFGCADQSLGQVIEE